MHFGQKTAEIFRLSFVNNRADASIQNTDADEVVVALVGNPNVGKSTVFNALTGMNQHTGNWPGKTVEVAQGKYTYKGKKYKLIDLPGTYSLLSQSEEERIAADFVQSGQANVTVMVADATCLERNLNLALQVLEYTDQVILCVNLLDEAKKTDVEIDLRELESCLGIPVVGTTAGSGDGLSLLQEKIRNLSDGFLTVHPYRLLTERDKIASLQKEAESDHISELFMNRATEIASRVVSRENAERRRGIDRFVLGRWSGRFVMVTLLFVILWLTMEGANVPSELLQTGFDRFGFWLKEVAARWPWWLSGFLLDGVYATAARVVSVMLPPMAIFFPLFTCLEDLGYLPRAAFLMDHSLQRCGSCGKQMLTMTMGLGCNAVGVTGCRIISSQRERLLAIVTNSLIPCNGRFPALITLCSVFLCNQAWIGAGILTCFLLLGMGASLLSTKLLSSTVLHGKQVPFVLELPPYRKPNLKKILVRSLLDRTVFVLGRAAAVAAPAGGMIWLMQNLSVGDASLMKWGASLLEPVGQFLGMSGAILLAFLLSFPANELLLPLIVVILQNSTNPIFQMESGAIGGVLLSYGWTWKTALCTMIFTLFHWPCSTTCLTIRKETGSWRWVLAAVMLPTVIGCLLCALISRI